MIVFLCFMVFSKILRLYNADRQAKMGKWVKTKQNKTKKKKRGKMHMNLRSRSCILHVHLPGLEPNALIDLMFFKTVT